MPSLRDSYDEFVPALTDRYGRPSSARAVDPDLARRLYRVVLGRTLAERRVESLLDALEDAGLIDPTALAAADPADLLQAAGDGPGASARKLLGTIRSLAGWIVERGGLDALPEIPTESLREDLRAIRGLGPTLVDALLLHGLNRPAFPVDRPAFRVLARHGWLDPTTELDDARSTLESLAPDDPAALADLAGWLDQLASEFCKAARPRCDRCSLRAWLPEGGPLEPDR